MQSGRHFAERRRSGPQIPLVPSAPIQPTAWHISLRFTVNAFRHGVEPLAILQKLRALGQECTVAIVDDRLPRFADMDPLSCHLGFEINLLTEVPCADIEAVFDAVRDDCIVRIFPPNRRSSDLITLLHALPDEGRLGDILVECGAISRDSLDEAIAHHRELKQAGATTRPTMPIADLLLEQQLLSPDIVDAALRRQSLVRSPMPALEDSKRDKAAYLCSLLDRTIALCAGLHAIHPDQQETIVEIHELARQIRGVLPGLEFAPARQSN